MLQTVYSQAAFAQFMHSEASKSFSIDLTNASLVECLTAKINFKARLFPHYPKSHQCLLSHIRLIEQELDCVILPTQVGDVFYSFFISRLLDRGVKPSSIRTLCYQLRSCLEWSAKHGAKISDTYAEFTVPDYRRPTIALTPDEVSMIYHLNLQPLVKRKDHRALLEKAKDMFVLSCNLGQRHSDMLRIQKKNFDRNIFTIVQQKTGHRAVVDIDKFAIDKKTTYEILEKYNYTAPYKATIGCYNSKIHELMKLAGLTLRQRSKMRSRRKSSQSTSSLPLILREEHSLVPMFSVEYQSTEYARPPVTQIAAHLQCISVRTLTDIILRCGRNVAPYFFRTYLSIHLLNLYK